MALRWPMPGDPNYLDPSQFPQVGPDGQSMSPDLLRLGMGGLPGQGGSPGQGIDPSQLAIAAALNSQGGGGGGGGAPDVDPAQLMQMARMQGQPQSAATAGPSPDDMLAMKQQLESLPKQTQAPPAQAKPPGFWDRLVQTDPRTGATFADRLDRLGSGIEDAWDFNGSHNRVAQLNEAQLQRVQMALAMQDQAIANQWAQRKGLIPGGQPPANGPTNDGAGRGNVASGFAPPSQGPGAGGPPQQAGVGAPQSGSDYATDQAYMGFRAMRAGKPEETMKILHPPMSLDPAGYPYNPSDMSTYQRHPEMTNMGGAWGDKYDTSRSGKPVLSPGQGEQVVFDANGNPMIVNAAGSVQAAAGKAAAVAGATAGATAPFDLVDVNVGGVTYKMSKSDALAYAKTGQVPQGATPSAAGATPGAAPSVNSAPALSSLIGPNGKIDPGAYFDKVIAKAEGGYAPHDMNGAPVNFGINQSANPDINVKSLTHDQAKQLFIDRYFNKSGAANMPPALAVPYIDMFFRNPKAAVQILHDANGDPSAFMDGVQAWNAKQAATPRGQPYDHSWQSRLNTQRAIVNGAQGGAQPNAQAGAQGGDDGPTPPGIAGSPVYGFNERLKALDQITKTKEWSDYSEAATGLNGLYKALGAMSGNNGVIDNAATDAYYRDRSGGVMRPGGVKVFMDGLGLPATVQGKFQSWFGKGYLRPQELQQMVTTMRAYTEAKQAAAQHMLDAYENTAKSVGGTLGIQLPQMAPPPKIKWMGTDGPSAPTPSTAPREAVEAEMRRRGLLK